MKKEKICGIYKITSPTGRVYIGQSVDIRHRWDKYYEKLRCEKQPFLCRSLNKYGVENHTFEIIEECSKEDLNCRERYWQDFYNVLDGGLNCVLQDCGEQRKVYTDKSKEQISLSKSGDKHHFYGKTHSDEHKENISKALKGYKHTKEYCIFKSENNINSKITLNIETGIFYISAKKAFESQQQIKNYKTFMAMLSGNKKNKTSFIYI